MIGCKSSPAPLRRTVRPPSIPDTYSLVGLPARIRSTGKLLQASGVAKLGAPGELIRSVKMVLPMKYMSEYEDLA